MNFIVLKVSNWKYLLPIFPLHIHFSLALVNFLDVRSSVFPFPIAIFYSVLSLFKLQDH